MRTSLASLVSLALLLVPTERPPPPQADRGDFQDPRDGEVYPWVRIGGQVWMAENLRYAALRGSMCWENREAECASRGRYYTWEAAMEAAPPGWHLPSDEEWKVLERTLGLSDEQIEDQGIDRGGERNTIGALLKKPGAWPGEAQGMKVPATNASGFSALPVGLFAQEQFFHEGYAAWWSSTPQGEKAWMRSLRFFDSKMGRDLNPKEIAMTIRCVQDASLRLPRSTPAAAPPPDPPE